MRLGSGTITAGTDLLHDRLHCGVSVLCCRAVFTYNLDGVAGIRPSKQHNYVLSGRDAAYARVFHL
jgi:hypothetical protein